MVKLEVLKLKVIFHSNRYNNLTRYYVVKCILMKSHAFNVLSSDCSCSNFINKKGQGKCRTGRCYVNQPSSCTDLKESNKYPGKQTSALACNNGMSGKK